jgi:hypothetical protein
MMVKALALAPHNTEMKDRVTGMLAVKSLIYVFLIVALAGLSYIPTLFHNYGNYAIGGFSMQSEAYFSQVGLKLDLVPSPQFLAPDNAIILFWHIGISKKPIAPLLLTALPSQNERLNKVLTEMRYTEHIVDRLSSQQVEEVLNEVLEKELFYPEQPLSRELGNFMLVCTNGNVAWVRFPTPEQTLTLLLVACPPQRMEGSSCQKIKPLVNLLTYRQQGK